MNAFFKLQISGHESNMIKGGLSDECTFTWYEKDTYDYDKYECGDTNFRSVNDDSVELSNITREKPCIYA